MVDTNFVNVKNDSFLLFYSEKAQKVIIYNLWIITHKGYYIDKALTIGEVSFTVNWMKYYWKHRMYMI